LSKNGDPVKGPGARTHSNSGFGPAVPALVRASAGSAVVHALLLAALTLGLPRSAGQLEAERVAMLNIPGAENVPDDALIALDSAELAALTPENLPPWPVPPELPDADYASQDVRPVSGPAGIVGETRAPAPDSGEGAGRNLPVAFRRDASTLRARNSTAARVYQPSREKTARQASSRQALRRERKTGVGDSARTESPRLSEVAPPMPELPAERLSEDELEPPIDSEQRLPIAPGTESARGEGPLDAETGQRSFDEQIEGPVRDRLAARATSNEPSPGLIDYAAVSARGPEAPTAVLANRGPAVAPGVTAVASTGTASASAGWPEPRPIGGSIGGDGTAEREYSREHLEIRRRVAQVLRFPKRMAVMLEQGEAIVQFLVERDGRVWGDVKLLKSAGFEEFDREALEVVRRAAPYPQLARPLVVRIRIPFENPMVR
jgi:TonB family protein